METKNLQDVEFGDIVYLDGSNSSDPDGDELFYLWTIQEETTQHFASPDEGMTLLETTQVGIWTIELTVSDGMQSDTDTLLVRVRPQILDEEQISDEKAGCSSINVSEVNWLFFSSIFLCRRRTLS